MKATIKTAADLVVGDLVYLTEDHAAEIPSMIGRVTSPISKQPGGWFFYLNIVADGGGSVQEDVSEIPVLDPNERIIVLT